MSRELPNRIRELRQAEGITLAQLAERVGTTNQQISHLELGKRQLTVEWLIRLGAALGCHPWAVVEEAEPCTSDEVAALRMLRSMSTKDRRRLLADLAS